MLRILLLTSVLLSVANLYGQQGAEERSCKTKLTECESNDNDYRLSRYKDIYVIFWNPNTKIQISFKYKLTSLLNLYLGYTQVMFWDIGKESSPFKDINFNPDFFYRVDFPEYTFIKALDIGLYEHKSNGKDGSDSRAWSGSYLKLYTIVKFYDWSFNWDTKVYWFYNFAMDSTNSDLREYSGFWDTKVSFINYYDKDKFIDRFSFYFSFFPGGKYSQRWGKGGQELGLKLRMGWGMFYPSLFFQFYHGYNESLLDYNQSQTSYRVGIAF